MQVDSIKVADYLKTTEETNILGKTVSSKNVESTKGDTLRSISIDQAKYNKSGKSENDFMDDLQKAQAMDLTDKSQMAMLTDTYGDQIEEKLEEDGHDPMDVDAHTIVTVVDQIKMHLAQAGHDISKMGGLSAEEIEAMTGSVSTALLMEKELTETLTDENIKYLIDNALKPTIENIYNATYKAPGMDEVMSDEEVASLMDKIAGQIEDVILEAGLDIEDTKIQEAIGKMLKMGIGLTAENLEYFTELQGYEKPAEEEIMQAISDIMLEDKDAKDAYLVKGYSVMDQAREVMEEINSIDESQLATVEARLQLEEIRMMMTVEVNFTLISRGVSIDTSDLADTIAKLEAQRQRLVMLLFGEDVEDVSNKVDIFEQAMNAVSDIKDMPAAMMGRIPDAAEYSLSQMQSVSVSVEATYMKAEASYEALWTAPRKDMGDSIQKAFQNVDDILEDLGLETTESNAKAVRSLAYNQMNINKDSVVSMQKANETVVKALANMTPKVVAEMIKRGQNPLDMTMKELKDTTSEIKAEVGNSSDESSFAKFLWKAEHTEGISEEERNSFIGIYRLLHQVEQSDGAAVGALVQQGTEVTLRNLMTAIRSEKHSNRRYDIDTDFGVAEFTKVEGLSITQQVEAAFHCERIHDAKEAMTPGKMQQFESENQYLDMSPDQFATAMENTDDIESEEAYRQYVTGQMQEAFKTEQEVYDILKNFDLPVTANNLLAMQEMMNNRNGAFRKVFGQIGDISQIDMEDLIEQITDEFMEACENPEEMAEAEEALQLRAVNIMKTMLVEQDVRTIDLKGMKLVQTQISTMGQLARGQETYHMPIMVADQMGNMTLKIVRGTQQSGLVEVALNAESTGTVTTSFRYEGGQINGEITCEREEIRAMLAENMMYIAQTIGNNTSVGVSMRFATDANVDVNSIYSSKSQIEVGNREDNESIQTRTLYGIARSFIETFSEIL